MNRTIVPSLAELPADTIVTAGDVARWLGISVRQVQRLGISYIDLGTRCRRYRVQDVKRWLEQRVRPARASA